MKRLKSGAVMSGSTVRSMVPLRPQTQCGLQAQLINSETAQRRPLELLSREIISGFLGEPIRNLTPLLSGLGSSLLLETGAGIQYGIIR